MSEEDQRRNREINERMQKWVSGLGDESTAEEIIARDTALAAANERIRELEENDEIIREDYQRLLANAKRTGSALEAEREVSDKLEKALIDCASGDAFGVCNSGYGVRHIANTVLAEVAAIRANTQAVEP